jgi:hypothetical protein
MAIEVNVPTSPVVSTDSKDQEDADEHVEEQVAYFRRSLDASQYEMCRASFESMAMDVYSPTHPEVSIEVVTQEPLKSVAYLRSSFI